MVLGRSVQGDGVRLAVREWPASGAAPGSRDRSALLLHGLASSSHIWDLVAPRLAASGVRSVGYDQRGHGRSGKPSSGYGFVRTSADAAAVIRRLRLRHPVVAGHSWGANVALELAVRSPRSVGSTVLVDGGFTSLHDRMDWATARRELAPPDLAGTHVDEFLGWVRSGLGGGLRVTPAIEAVALSLMHVDRQGRIRPRLSRENHLRILHALWAQDPLELLRRVRVPTLLLAVRPTDGDTIPAEFLRAKERAASEVRAIGGLVRFEWATGIHDLPLLRPELVARRIVAIGAAS
jgi:lipase